MALYFKEKRNGTPLPEVFKQKKFRSYSDMADFADKNNLPVGTYWIRNDKGSNLLTSIRELEYTGSRFRVEGRGNI